MPIGSECMYEFNVIGQCCSICKQNKPCTETVVITKEKRQKVEFWCKECFGKIIDEERQEQEKSIQEVYASRIRSSY